jgi:hypothetical protein
MSRSRLVALAAGLLIAVAEAAHAQGSLPLPATPPQRFESWQAAAPLEAGITPAASRFAATSRNRGRRALIGGAIGAAAGVVFCTAVSTLANDSAEGGLSFCPLDSYLLIGGAGFALGATIGWATAR